MIFCKSENLYLAEHCTGPTHNLLVIKLVKSDAEVTPLVKTLPPGGQGGYGAPSARAVLSYVLEGAAEANAQMGTNYRVAEVRFIANDSQIEPVYAYITKKLIEHIENGGEFTAFAAKKCGGEG